MTTDAPTPDSGKRLVVFGAGYVGGEVVRTGLARGLRVTALTRNAEKARALGELGAEVVVGDLASDEWHAALGGGAEWVVNCVSSGGGGVAGYRRSYVDGMRSILAWAEKVGGAQVGVKGLVHAEEKGDAEGKPALARPAVSTLLYTSSTSVYPQSGGARVDELASTEGAGETARVLLEAEALVRGGVGGGGSGGSGRAVSAVERWFVLRLAGIYGPGRHHVLDQLREGATELGGRGEHRLNLIHRDDIVSAIWAALDAPTAVRGEIFNVADDGAAPKAELARWLAARVGAAEPRFTGEPTAGRRAVTPDRVIENAKIKAMLGWRPRYPSFREGYADILEA